DKPPANRSVGRGAARGVRAPRFSPSAESKRKRPAGLGPAGRRLRRESEGRNGPAGDVAFAVEPGDQLAQDGRLATQEAVALRVDDLRAEHEQDVVLEPRRAPPVPP